MLSKKSSNKYDLSRGIVKRSQSLLERSRVQVKPRLVAKSRAAIPLPTDGDSEPVPRDLEGSYRTLCVSPIAWATSRPERQPSSTRMPDANEHHRVRSCSDEEGSPSPSALGQLMKKARAPFPIASSPVSASASPATSTSAQLVRGPQFQNISQPSSLPSAMASTVTSSPARFPHNCLVTTTSRHYQRDKPSDIGMRNGEAAGRSASTSASASSPQPMSTPLRSLSAMHRVALPKQLFDSLPESRIDPDGVVGETLLTGKRSPSSHVNINAASNSGAPLHAGGASLAPQLCPKTMPQSGRG